MKPATLTLALVLVACGTPDVPPCTSPEPTQATRVPCDGLQATGPMVTPTPAPGRALEDTPPPRAGTYVLTAMTAGSPVRFTMVLEEDGTYHSVASENDGNTECKSGTWAVCGNEIVIGEEKGSFETQGSTLTLQNETIRFSFEFQP